MRVATPTALKFLLVLGLTLRFNAAEEILVFAAASLTDALKAISTEYQKTSADQIRFSFGASSMLARQIEEGAPADLFISAHEEKVHQLELKGMVKPGSRAALLSNTLVIVTAADAKTPLQSPRDLLALRRVALAETRTVPAGIYARQYLTQLGLWDSIQPKVVPVENVRAALAAVESGNVDAAIVYKTDALISSRVRIGFEVPHDDGPRIVYPACALRSTRHPEAALKFLQHLQSPSAGQVFARYGFIVLSPTRE